MPLPDNMVDPETGEIKCERCGCTRFEIRPKKIRRAGKDWQRIVCVNCGDWFLAVDPVEADEQS